MKSWGHAGLCVVALLLLSTGAPAETSYIKTIVKITLRTGPGEDHKIISMITSGQRIEVLGTEGKWSQIQTENGQIGWIMTSLISAEEPSRHMPTTPASADQALLERQASLQKEIEALHREKGTLESELAESRKALDTLNASFQAFKNASAESPGSGADLRKTTAALRKQKEKVTHLESQITDLQVHQYIWWFLLGAGVLIVGFAIGHRTKHQRRRSLLK